MHFWKCRSARALSRVSQRLNGLANELFVAPQFFDSRLRQQREGNRARSRWQVGGSQRVAHHGGCLLEPALPVGLAGVAKDEAVGMESGGVEHGARYF